jgi:hypothetical protein
MTASMEITVVERPVESRESSPPPRQMPPLSYLSTAEVAECTCPDACERDHDRD